MQKELQKCGKIAILGQDYTIYVNNAEDIKYMGVTDFKTKSITISKECFENVGDIFKTIKHEIIHAMLYECGLTKYTYDETLVEWIANKGFQIENLAEAVYNMFGGC